MKLILEETFDLENVVELNESTGQKTYVIKGTFSTPDKKNRNGRIYASKLWEDNVSKYQAEIAGKTVNTLMEKEHPPRTAVDPWSAVAQIRKLEMREGLVYGEAVLLNIQETEVMRQLIDRGIKIGVSSRGVGKMKGDIVEEFNLITYDIVSTPSDYNANLEGFNESMILEGVEIESNGKGGWICTPEGCTLSEAKQTTVKYSQNELNVWLDDYIASGVDAFKKSLLQDYRPQEVEFIIGVVKAEDHRVNEAVIEGRETIKGIPVHIMYQAPKGYWAEGKSSQAKKAIKKRFFDSYDEALEHATLEIEGMISESPKKERFIDIRSLGNKELTDFLNDVTTIDSTWKYGKEKTHILVSDSKKLLKMMRDDYMSIPSWINENVAGDVAMTMGKKTEDDSHPEDCKCEECMKYTEKDAEKSDIKEKNCGCKAKALTETLEAIAKGNTLTEDEAKELELQEKFKELFGYEYITEVKMSKKRFKSELVWNIDQGKTPSIVGKDVMDMIRTDEFQDFMWNEFQKVSKTLSLNDFESWVDGLIDTMQNHKGGLGDLDNIKKLIGESNTEDENINEMDADEIKKALKKAGDSKADISDLSGMFESEINEGQEFTDADAEELITNFQKAADKVTNTLKKNRMKGMAKEFDDGISKLISVLFKGKEI